MHKALGFILGTRKKREEKRGRKILKMERKNF
jgi:hypothetical protein